MNSKKQTKQPLFAEVDLFDKTIFKNDKDRSGSSEPNLFNF